MKKSKAMCSGCTENFYNGNNDLGVSECWSFKAARVVKKKFVHMNNVPPWDHAAVTTLSCYRKRGHVSVGPNVRR